VSDGSERAPRLRDGLRHCLLVFAALRIGVSLLGVFAIGLFPAREGVPTVPGWPNPSLNGGWHLLFTALERQDAIWFLRIASRGYAPTDGSAAFFPLYPLASKVVAFFTGGHPLLGATLVSNASLFGAMLVLYALVTLEYSEAHARKAVAYLAVFPTAFFLVAPYSESLFLLLSVSAFWFARRDRWALAALLALLAALTRSIGVVLAPALVVEAVHQARQRGVPLWPRTLAACSAALGPPLYLLFWAARYHDLLRPYRIQQQWQRVATFPLVTVANALEQAWRYRSYWLIDVLVSGVVILAGIVGLTRISSLRPSYSAYLWLSLLVPLAYPLPGRALMSVPRFCAVIFPAFIVLADLSERRRLSHTLVVATFAGGLGLLTVLFVTWWHIF
jgi:hypothetical protein